MILSGQSQSDVIVDDGSSFCVLSGFFRVAVILNGIKMSRLSPCASCSLPFLSFAVFYDRASGQTASHDWWLLLYGALLFRDYNNSPLPGTASPDIPLLVARVLFPRRMPRPMVSGITIQKEQFKLKPWLGYTSNCFYIAHLSHVSFWEML